MYKRSSNFIFALLRLRRFCWKTTPAKSEEKKLGNFTRDSMSDYYSSQNEKNNITKQIWNFAQF